MKLSRLAAKRREKQWSMEKLAVKSECSLSTIYRLERDGECTEHTGNRIARALGCKVEDLTTKEGNNG